MREEENEMAVTTNETFVPVARPTMGRLTNWSIAPYIHVRSTSHVQAGDVVITKMLADQISAYPFHCKYCF